MKIDLRKLISASGGEIPFSGTADLSGEDLYGAYPFQSPVTYSGKIVNHLDVLRLTGSIHTIYSTCCSRCRQMRLIPTRTSRPTTLDGNNGIVIRTMPLG